MITTIAIVLFIAGTLFALLRPARPSAKLLPMKISNGAYARVNPVAEMAKSCPATGRKYAIVGCGFVGRCIAEYLLDRGDGAERAIVCVDMLPRSPFADEPRYCHSAANFGKPIENLDARIEYVRADITDAASIKAALSGRGVEVVFMTAAIISLQRLQCQVAASERINIGGTKNVVDALVAAGIPYLVYTSTAHVVLGTHNAPWRDLTEEAPLVTRETAFNHYAWTKAEAEKVVVAAHGRALAVPAPAPAARSGSTTTTATPPPTTLSTVSVRLCSGVCGFGDRFMLQRLCQQGQDFICDADAMNIDYIYVCNVAFGQLLAEKHLVAGTRGIAGDRVNLVGEVVNNHQMYDLTRQHWDAQQQGGGLPLPPLRIGFLPSGLMTVLAHFIELLQWATNDAISKSLPADLLQLTPGMLNICWISYSYSGHKAAQLLGYRDLYTLEQGLQRTAAQYRAVAERAQAAAAAAAGETAKSR
jgi:nucleoside-diphosphate-sugar epimerase